MMVGTRVSTGTPFNAQVVKHHQTFPLKASSIMAANERFLVYLEQDWNIVY